MEFNIRLDHIGIATPDLGDDNFFKLLGLLNQGVETVPTEGVEVEFLNTENQARIELLKPLDPQGVIAKFIAKNGPGIHHICFRVDQLDKLIENLKNLGVKLVNEVPRRGAHNCRVVFVHPKSTGGVLVELSEKAN